MSRKTLVAKRPTVDVIPSKDSFIDPPPWLSSIEPTIVGLKPFTHNSDVIVWQAVVNFVQWCPVAGESKPARKETYGKKLISCADGTWTVAEIELARRLRKAGWHAGWLDTYGQAPKAWKEWLLDRNLLAPCLRDFLDQTRSITGERGGNPDVMAWRGNSLADAVFLEYKGPGDRIKQSQINWLRAALKLGMSIKQYAVVKWLKVTSLP